MTNHKEYLQAQIAESIVRVYCDDREDGWVDGYIVGVGQDLFALEVITDGAHLNGFNCILFSEVTKLEVPAPHHDFIQKAIDIRGIERSSIPDFDLTSLHTLLNAGNGSFPFVSLHLEHHDGEQDCYIGRIESVTNSSVTLTCIDPDAKWETQSDTYPLNLIYRVDYGDSYAEALFLVSSEA